MDQQQVNMILSNSWVLLIIALWTIPWKAIALWKSARRKELTWFIVLMIFNTLAILEILYIFVFSRQKKEV